MLKSVNIRMDFCAKGCGFCLLFLTFDVSKRNQKNFIQICFLMVRANVAAASTTRCSLAGNAQ